MFKVLGQLYVTRPTEVLKLIFEHIHRFLVNSTEFIEF